MQGYKRIYIGRGETDREAHEEEIKKSNMHVQIV